MVCLAPRALEGSVRPRRLSGVLVGPSTSPLDVAVPLDAWWYDLTHAASLLHGPRDWSRTSTCIARLRLKWPNSWPRR